MKRHPILLAGVIAAMVAVAALAPQKEPGKLLVLEWAHKAKAEAPPRAILIELGLKDDTPRNWSSRAVVTGAKVTHREGYRFRKDDKLVDPDGWQAKSHRAMRGPAGMPKGVAIIPDRLATIGVVLHLSELTDDAVLKIAAPQDTELKDETVALKEVLNGKPQKLWNGAAQVRLISTAIPVATGKTEDDFPAACYGPDGTLWVAYISYTVRDDTRRIEAPPYQKQPESFKDLYTPEFGDQLFVKSYKDGKWSEPIAVTGPKEDLVRCAIAAEGDGTVWVAYSANRNGNHDVYVRPIKLDKSQDNNARPGPEEKLILAEVAGKYLNPIAGIDSNGKCFVMCQLWGPATRQKETINVGSELPIFSHADGKWEARSAVGIPSRNWFPNISFGADGKAAWAYDGYNWESGDYDVVAGPGQPLHELIAISSRFEARPSITHDPAGRLWIAYEEGPESWGKDFGALDNRGNPLYFRRTVKVVCLVDGKLMKPVAELPALADKTDSPDTGQKVETMARYAYPKIGSDGKGRVWLTYRQKFGTRYSSHPGSYWLTFARRLDGDKWTEPIELHHSDGLLDDRPVLLPHAAGGLIVIHNTDGRYTTPETIDNDVYMSYVDLPSEPGGVSPRRAQAGPA